MNDHISDTESVVYVARFSDPSTCSGAISNDKRRAAINCYNKIKGAFFTFEPKKFKAKIKIDTVTSTGHFQPKMSDISVFNNNGKTAVSVPAGGQLNCDGYAMVYAEMIDGIDGERTVYSINFVEGAKTYEE